MVCLQALVRLTANRLDTVARKPFLNVRIGQALLSIVREPKHSAVLQVSHPPGKIYKFVDYSSIRLQTEMMDDTSTSYMDSPLIIDR